jgi:hypothetical protein
MGEIDLRKPTERTTGGDGLVCGCFVASLDSTASSGLKAASVKT